MVEHSPAEIKQAIKMAAQIKAKVDALLQPLEMSMVIGKWAPDLRAIMWEAVAREAMRRAAIEAAGE